MWVVRGAGVRLVVGTRGLRVLSRRRHVDELELWLARPMDAEDCAKVAAAVEEALAMLRDHGRRQRDLVRKNVIFIAVTRRRMKRLRGRAQLLVANRGLTLDAAWVLKGGGTYVALMLVWAAHYLEGLPDIDEVANRRRAYEAQRAFAPPESAWMSWLEELASQDLVLNPALSR